MSEFLEFGQQLSGIKAEFFDEFLVCGNVVDQCTESRE